ncbi:hypothetical protein EXIGLDRAFT_777139 [Exidia glandulosa HHB12029]|uniref:Uncharacterized protein n=1 Tax=Exidia glandulosa HHB12029 TaxID=1314781 RepID=A0A165D5V9_EXIGL|nr:hypothetical protein EXIGLDRAFT_777139 [Exidia glandulosa HHB12029]
MQASIPYNPIFTAEAFRRLLCIDIASPLNDWVLEERTLQLLLRYLGRHGHPSNLDPAVTEGLAKSQELSLVDPSVIRPHLMAMALYPDIMCEKPRARPARVITLRFLPAITTYPRLMMRDPESVAHLDTHPYPWGFHLCFDYISIHVGEPFRHLIDEGWKSKDADEDSQFDLFVHMMILPGVTV